MKMTRNDLRLEAGGALAPPLPRAHGVSRREVAEVLPRLAEVVPALLAPGAEAGFLQLPRRRAALRAVLEAAAKLRRGVDDVVHLGIGGSSLGAETLLRALAHPHHNLLSPRRRRAPRVHFVDNADGDTLAGLLDCLDLRRTLLHVVSKSGGTVETAAAFAVLREAFARRRINWRKRCVFTTGASGALRELAAAEGVPCLDFPEDVGGRWSALTPSGLLTPALAGVDVAAVVAGARRFAARVQVAPLRENPAAIAAAIAWLLAERRGKTIHAFMPYADGLEALSRWFVQLCGESLGKPRPSSGIGAAHEPGESGAAARDLHEPAQRGGGRDGLTARAEFAGGVGPTPLPARGATDQHSQMQLFAEGPADKLVIFVAVARPRQRLALPGGPPAGWLRGIEMADLLRAEREGSAFALARAGRPTLTWELPTLTPAALGQLLTALEVQTACQAALYGIDAYDQPGVEAGKAQAFARLGRPGYDLQRREAATHQPPDWKI